MKKLKFIRWTPWLIAMAFFIVMPIEAQKKRASGAAGPPSPIIFAVVNDGKWIEPIAKVQAGKLVDPSEGADANDLPKIYYKPRTVYSLIFGGAQEGLVTVVKSNVGTECGGASADVTIKSGKVKAAGLIMPLATSVKLKSDAAGLRRRPTPAERSEVEKLVRAEFTKNGSSAAAVKNLRYHNLTAVDLDGDETVEWIGSYWIAPTTKERRLLFFVASNSGNNLVLAHSDHSVVTPDDVMSGDLKDIDAGRGAELLLDVLDYDGDGVKEIFTIGQACEGNNYYAYKLADGKWAKVHESYVYRCAF